MKFERKPKVKGVILTEGKNYIYAKCNKRRATHRTCENCTIHIVHVRENRALQCVMKGVKPDYMFLGEIQLVGQDEI